MEARGAAMVSMFVGSIRGPFLVRGISLLPFLNCTIRVYSMLSCHVPNAYQRSGLERGYKSPAAGLASARAKGARFHAV